MTELLPCPFCGERPTAVDDRDGAASISCENAECGIANIHSATLEDAAEFWNTRPNRASAAGTQEPAAIGDILELFKGGYLSVAEAIDALEDAYFASSDGSCSVPTATIAATQTACDEGESAGDIQSRDATARRMSETVGSLALGQSTQREDGASPGPSEANAEAEMVCAEAYQAVGCMLSDLGQFDSERGQKLLDNLSRARMVHQDILPWPSFEAPSQPAAAQGEASNLQKMQIAPGGTDHAQSAVTLRWARPGIANTLDEMRANAWKSGLADIGDTVLIWVNEGDLWQLLSHGIDLKEFTSSDGQLGEAGRAGVVADMGARPMSPAGVAPGPSDAPLSELDQIAFELEEWIRQPDWAEKFTLQDMVDWASDKRPIHIVQKLRQISARQGAPELTEGERGRETWRPIESAYKQSGKHLRMFGDGADFAKCEFIGMWWGCEWREAYSRQSVYPTHWMPLNPSPSPLSTDRLDLAFAEHRAAIDSVIDPDGAFQAGVTAAMEVVGEMRQSEAGLFDAAHSGQRGEDRSTALYDAYHAIRKALSLSSTQSLRQEG